MYSRLEPLPTHQAPVSLLVKPGINSQPGQLFVKHLFCAGPEVPVHFKTVS
jgi:hypothetical protein